MKRIHVTACRVHPLWWISGHDTGARHLLGSSMWPPKRCIFMKAVPRSQRLGRGWGWKVERGGTRLPLLTALSSRYSCRSERFFKTERRDRFVGHSQADGGQTQLRRGWNVTSQRRRIGLHNAADTNVITEQLKYLTIPSPLITHRI